MQEQEIRDEPMMYLACEDCGVRTRVRRSGLSAVLRQHRAEHPDHGQRPFSSYTGYAEFADPPFAEP